MAKKGFWSDFKEFAVKGNMIDMAVGVIIGGAFGKIITSLVNDILMPPLGVLIGGMDFKELKIVLPASDKVAAGAEAVAPATINYGMFIQNVLDFVIIALCIFMMIRLINQLKAQPKPVEEAPAAPAPKADDVVLLEEIRDLLKAQDKK